MIRQIAMIAHLVLLELTAKAQFHNQAICLHLGLFPLFAQGIGIDNALAMDNARHFVMDDRSQFFDLLVDLLLGMDGVKHKWFLLKDRLVGVL